MTHISFGGCTYILFSAACLCIRDGCKGRFDYTWTSHCNEIHNTCTQHVFSWIDKWCLRLSSWTDKWCRRLSLTLIPNNIHVKSSGGHSCVTFFNVCAPTYMIQLYDCCIIIMLDVLLNCYEFYNKCTHNMCFHGQNNDVWDYHCQKFTIIFLWSNERQIINVFIWTYSVQLYECMYHDHVECLNNVTHAITVWVSQ